VGEEGSAETAREYGVVFVLWTGGGFVPLLRGYASLAMRKRLTYDSRTPTRPLYDAG